MKKEKVKKKVKKKEEEKKVITSYSDMGDKEMDSLFLELYYSPQWQAILRLNRVHHNNIMATLSSVDPSKDPTQIARAQGTDIGLFTLEAKVNNIVEQTK